MAVYSRRKPGAIPPDAVYVGRPTIYGNPFTVAQYGQRGAVQMYARWIREPAQAWLVAKMQRELVSCDLVCWCAPAPCHADVIAEIVKEG